jgi:hypothetical protein
MTTRAKVLLGAIVAGALSMQVPQVKDVIMPLVANHPHVSTLVGAIFTVITLLQNPVIQEVLGIEDEKKVVVDPDGTTTATHTTTSTLTKEA